MTCDAAEAEERDAEARRTSAWVRLTLRRAFPRTIRATELARAAADAGLVPRAATKAAAVAALTSSDSPPVLARANPHGGQTVYLWAGEPGDWVGGPGDWRPSTALRARQRDASSGIPGEEVGALNERIERNFARRPPRPEREPRLAELRAVARDLAYVLHARCPPGREAALAQTKLEECLAWAEAAVTRSGRGE